MINTRIAVSLMSIVAALALVGGTAYAYFSDTAVSSANTFAAGSVDINLKDTASPINSPFDVEGMMPGDTEYRYIVVTNDGTEDLKWRAYISGGDGGALFGALRIKSMTLNPNDFPDADELSGYTIAGPTNHVVVTTPIPFSDLLDPNSTPLVWDQGVGGTVDAFKPGWAAVYKVEVEMDPAAGNEYNGKSWSGDMTFYATQESNIGW